MQRLNKIIAWIGLTALALPAMAQEKHAFSIQQALDYAKKNNVQVKNALLGIQLQQQQNREITAAAYPQINGSIGATYNPYVATQVLPNFISPSVYQVLKDQGVKDGNGNPIVMPSDFGNIAAQFGTKFNASAGVDLNQLLFDGQVFIGQVSRRQLFGGKRNRRPQGSIRLVTFRNRRPCRGSHHGGDDVPGTGASSCARGAEPAHLILPAGDGGDLRGAAGPDAPRSRSMAAAARRRRDGPAGDSVAPLA